MEVVLVAGSIVGTMVAEVHGSIAGELSFGPQLLATTRSFAGAIERVGCPKEWVAARNTRKDAISYATKRLSFEIKAVYALAGEHRGP